MKKIIRFFGAALAVVALLPTAPAWAEKQSLPAPVESVPAPASEVGIGGPALWKVSDNDTTIYLFGTIHALPRGIEWYDGKIADALQHSDTLVTEIIMEPDMGQRITDFILGHGILPQGTSLRSLLDEQDREEFDALVTRLGEVPERFDPYEPWYPAMFLAITPLTREAGFDPASGAEVVLSELAGPVKQRAALETLDQQLSLLDNLPQEEQIRYLNEVVDGTEELKRIMADIVPMWLAGDVDGMADLLMADDGNDHMITTVLLHDRNRTWAAWTREQLERPGTLFVAVGAGHLIGEESVQAHLGQAGIEVARVQ